MQYNEQSIRAQNFLKRHYNDIDIVVEDSGNRNIWYFIIRSCVPKHIKLDSITLAGGRKAVENACKADQADDGRKRLYIVDGDFDYLLGKRKKRLKHLYRLRAFNVENLLFENDALLPIALSSDPLCAPGDVLDRLMMSDLIDEVSEPFIKLFEAYAISESFGSGIQTCNYKVERFCTEVNDGLAVELEAVRTRLFWLLRELMRRYGAALVRERYTQVRARADLLSVSLAVSGKSYLLPLVHRAIQKRFGYRGSRESLKVALAMNAKTCAEPYLKARFTTILQ
ncbi:MAG: DUF4435 domain-containing protein [Erythrobacter sp.]